MAKSTTPKDPKKDSKVNHNKQERLMRTTTMIRYNFSPKEIGEKAQQIGEALKDLEQIEEELAAIKSDYKEQIVKKNSQIKELSNHVTQKYEMRNMECYLRKDFKLKERQYVTHEGEVLKTEPLTPSDYQLEIEEQQKEDSKKDAKKKGGKEQKKKAENNKGKGNSGSPKSK